MILDGNWSEWLGGIHGTKFNDLNSNGVKDEGEPGLADWKIYLDANESGEWDPGEPYEMTAADGSYSFSGLGPGTYVVAEEPQAGWDQTYPGPDPNLTIERVTLAPDGLTSVPNLFGAGEISGGVHGRNRLMGNSLLEVTVFGRRAGQAAGQRAKEVTLGKLTLNHVEAWEKQLAEAGIDSDVEAPLILPRYARHVR